MPRMANSKQRRNFKSRAKAIELPQIGQRTEECRYTEAKLNEYGVKGCMLLGVTTNGANNRYAHAVFMTTPQRWSYKVVQFSMRDPIQCDKILDKWGEEGWIFHAVYSQGANMMATACVLIKPMGELELCETNERLEQRKAGLEATIAERRRELESAIRDLERAKSEYDALDAGPEQDVSTRQESLVESEASETSGGFGTENLIHVQEGAPVGVG